MKLYQFNTNRHHCSKIGEYQNKITSGYATCKMNQNFLNKLAEKPYSSEKIQKANLILSVCLLVTHSVPKARHSQISNGNHCDDVFSSSFTRQTPTIEPICHANAIRPLAESLALQQRMSVHPVSVGNTPDVAIQPQLNSRFLSFPGAYAEKLTPRNFTTHLSNQKKLSSQTGLASRTLPLAADNAATATQILPTLLAKYPDMRQSAKKKIHAAIKQKFHIEVDPDKVFFHRFHSAVNDPVAYTGWQHEKYSLIESRSITDCVIHNFSAADQDNMDNINMMGGLYKTNGQGVTLFDAQNEVKLLPSKLAKLIWDMNFYESYKQDLEQYWIDRQVPEICNAYILIDSLRNSSAILTDTHKEQLLRVFGLSNAATPHLNARFFDIDGYFATDMLVLQADHTSEVILYMPRDRKIIPFTNLRDLRVWIINNCVDDTHRKSIAGHFAISDEEDGFFYDGIDSWLQTLNKKGIDDLEYICKKNNFISGKVNHAILDKQKQRDLDDIKRLIKSDNDVRIDMAVRYFSVINNLIPNPVTPFISMGLDIEQALNSDTWAERKEAKNRLANDIISIALMALTEVGMRKLGSASNSLTRVASASRSEDIETMLRQSIADAKYVLNTSCASNYLERLNLIEKNTFIYSINDQNVIVHPEIMSVIKKFNIADTTLEFTESLLCDDNGIIIGQDGNNYLQINNRYYQVDKDDINNTYFFTHDQNVRFFLDDGHEIKTFFLYGQDRSIFESLSPSCRARRAPIAMLALCPGLSEDLANRVSTLDSVSDESILNNIEPHDEIPQLYKSLTSRNMYLKLGDEYYWVRFDRRKKIITLLKKCTNTSSSWTCFRNRGRFENGPALFYGKNTNKFYLNNKIGHLQEKSGFSYAVAKLDLFCQNTRFQQLTREEISALKGYASNDFDFINEFLRAGTPDTWMNARYRESAFDSIRAIESGLRKIPAYEATVFRGTIMPSENFNRLRVNDVLHSLSFISTSADSQVAQKFALNTADPVRYKGVFYEIQIKKSGHPIGLYTTRFYEAEVLLNKDNWFLIKQIEDNKVFLEELTKPKAEEFLKNNPTAMTHTL
jgi:hypothetical protein